MTEQPLTQHLRDDRRPHSLVEWRALGGYKSVEQAIKRHSPAEIVEMVTEANLRGRGGAGFPAGKKWAFMPEPGAAAGDGPSYFCINADEMEACTFKDRLLMESLPHLLLEGTIIGSYATGASEVFIVIRDAYRPAARILQRAIEEAREAGYLGRDILGSGFDLDIEIHMSAGRYIVGEESGLIEALEGKRPVPRQRPPYPAQTGLWGRPTTVNNVETICNVPGIVLNGADWFRGLSRTDDGGTKLFGIAGNVREPCLIEAPMGTPAGALLERAGGLHPGRRLRAWQPGGGSTGFLEEQELGVPMDFDHIAKTGSAFGTGMMVVLDDTACPVAVTARYEMFYARESCGWCTPCRDGLPWAARILFALEDGQGAAGDLDTLRMHIAVAGPEGRTFCALAPGAIHPLSSAMERFGDLFEAHLHGGCPVGRV